MVVALAVCLSCESVSALQGISALSPNLPDFKNFLVLS
jgi:hypothetical protein